MTHPGPDRLSKSHPLLYRAFLACLWVMCFLPLVVQAQSSSIRGTVTDVSGISLPGASVFIVELSVGVVTNRDGVYTFDLATNQATPDSLTLRAQFIGFRTQDRIITLTGGEQIQDFELKLDPLNLDEVVVTGIASERSKATSEVSVSHLETANLLENNAYNDLSQLMAGKIPGVTVQPTSGNLGGGIRLLMRSSTGLNGDGQPVIYLDGVRINGDEFYGADLFGQGMSMLATLNPEDIESIDVLPGPAGAALYGTSGSNGVVLIKTKRGSIAGIAGQGPSISYKGVMGSNQQVEKFTELNAAFPEFANDMFRNGAIQQHSFSVAGGSPSLRYFSSMDLRDENGHFANSSQNRKGFRLNLESFRGEKFNMRLSSALSVMDNRAPLSDDLLLGYFYNTLIIPVAFPFADRDFLDKYIKKDRHVTRSVIGVQTEYTPISNLVLKGTVGFDRTHVEETFRVGFIVAFGDNGGAARMQEGVDQYTYDFNGRYAITLPGDIESTSILGTQIFDRRSSALLIEGHQYVSELISNIGSTSEIVADEQITQRKEAGVYFQQEFSRSQKYFLTLGIRRDYASSIGSDATSIWYPKFSTAVRLDRAMTLPSSITFLKARFAYGATGQLPRPLDNSTLRWRAEPSGYGIGGVIGFVGNPSVKPERVEEIEFGLETEIWDNVGVDLTYYRQNVNDSIIDFIIAPSVGLSSVAAPINVGSATGKGLELSISGSPYRTRSFGVDLSVVWNYQTNTVEDMGGAPPILDKYWKINTITEGLPRSAFQDWSSHPTFASDGAYTGAAVSQSDTDGDGAPDAALMGIPYPKNNGSFGLDVRAFQHLTATFLFEWMSGNSVFNNTLANQSFNGTLAERNRALVQIGLADATDVGLEGEGIQVLTPGERDYREAATTVAETEYIVDGIRTQGNFVEDADFIKLREVSVRYDFTHLLTRSGYSPDVESISLTLSGRNLWKSTKYKGLDPEVNVYGSRDLTRGLDFLTLPQPRVISATLSVRF